MPVTSLRRGRFLRLLLILPMIYCCQLSGAAELPEVMQQVIDSRKQLKSGRLKVRVVSNLSEPIEGFQSSIRNYLFVIDGDRLRVEMSEEKPVEPNKPFAWKISKTGEVGREMPYLDKASHSELKGSDSQIATEFAQYTFDFRAIGLVATPFETLRTNGLSYIEAIAAHCKQSSVRSSTLSGRNVLVWLVERNHGRLEYFLDPAQQHVPILIRSSRFGEGGAGSVIESTIKWMQHDGLILPSNVILTVQNPGDTEKFIREEWEVSFTEVNNPIESSEFDWEALGIKDSEVVSVKTLSPTGPHETALLQWNGTGFSDYKPSVLVQSDIDSSHGWVWFAGIGACFILTLLLMVFAMRQKLASIN